MEMSLLVRSALVALLLSAGVDSSRAQNCQDRLNNNRYRCQGSNTLVGEAQVCLQFVSPGVMSTEFDVVEELGFLGPNVVTIPYGCVCNPVGVSAPDGSSPTAALEIVQ